MSQEERWRKSISVDPGSPSHELGVFSTSAEEIARHMAIMWERRKGGPRGRGASPEEEQRRRVNGTVVYEVMRPLAQELLDRLPDDLNRWFRSLLEIQPIASRLTADQVWEVLERWPAERALELLSVSSIQDRIIEFRKDRRSGVRNRLRKAFRRLAVAPARGGRNPRRRIPAREHAQLIEICRRIHADCKAFRNEWKGSLTDAEAWQAARHLVNKYCPTATYGSTNLLIRALRNPSLRPLRATEAVIQNARPDLTKPVIRKLLQETKRTQ